MASVMMTILGVLSLSCPNVLCFMDMEELKSVYYGLDILNEPVVVSQDVPMGAVHVTSKYGQQYQCIFPNHSLDERRKEEEEKLAIETGIVEILKPMGLNDCLFKSKDWWSYEFCFGKYIRQFHMEDGEIKGNIIYLGYYHEDFDWNNETAREERLKSKSALNRYHSQVYTLGTRCDLTDQMRKAEVRFICEENSEDYLSRVDESETCVYTVTVMTSRICRHPYLKAPAKRKAVPITCNPLLSEDDFHDYVLEKEKQQKKEESLKAAAKDALNKEDSSKLNWDQELSNTLENEMSTSAKKLLTKQFSEQLAKAGTSPISKEEFQKTYGNDEIAWQTYQMVVKQKLQQGDVKNLRTQGNQQQDASSKDGETEEKKDTTPDEDDEIISEFEKEISTIRAKFQSSQNKLTNIKKKLAIERNWETEIENAIREAEEELGVKFDQNLITGLSSTLDKLVSTLYDTEKELSSADKELGKLKPGKKILRNVDEKDDDVNDEDELLSSEVKNAEEENVEVAVDVDDGGIHDGEDVVVNKHDEVGIVKPSFTGDNTDDLHGKIQAPPRLKDKSKASQSSYTAGSDGHTAEESVTKLKNVGEDTNDGGSNEVVEAKAEIEITVKNIESNDVDLPQNVQKLLEESVRKEFEKQRQQSDSETLSFDSDHSFNRDKSVHIIQQEDEDGKTNRFIFVFGFNTFNDEATERKKHSSLEDNYSFVYNKKKEKKEISA